MFTTQVWPSYLTMNRGLPGQTWSSSCRVTNFFSATEWGDDQLVRACGDKGADHVQDLGIAFDIGHIQPCMESGEAGKMDVAVTKDRDQRTIAQLHPGTAGEFRRQFIANIDNPPAVLDQIPANTILRIAGQNGAFVDFHGGTSH